VVVGVSPETSCKSGQESCGTTTPPTLKGWDTSVPNKIKQTSNNKYMITTNQQVINISKLGHTVIHTNPQMLQADSTTPIHNKTWSTAYSTNICVVHMVLQIINANKSINKYKISVVKQKTVKVQTSY
jgi:hypothetical protein